MKSGGRVGYGAPPQAVTSVTEMDASGSEFCIFHAQVGCITRVIRPARFESIRPSSLTVGEKALRYSASNRRASVHELSVHRRRSCSAPSCTLAQDSGEDVLMTCRLSCQTAERWSALAHGPRGSATPVDSTPNKAQAPAFAHCSGEGTKSEASRKDSQSSCVSAEGHCALGIVLASTSQSPPPIRGGSVQQRETHETCRKYLRRSLVRWTCEHCSHVAEGSAARSLQDLTSGAQETFVPQQSLDVFLEAKRRSATTASGSRLQHRNSQLEARCASAAVASGPRLLHSSQEAKAKYLTTVTCVPSLHLQTRWRRDEIRRQPFCYHTQMRGHVHVCKIVEILSHGITPAITMFS